MAIKRKSKRKASKSARVKRKTSVRKPMARKRKSTRRRSSKTRSVTRRITSGNIFKSGMVGKAVAGIGAGTLAGIAVNAFAPQFAGLAKPVAALLAGGPIGAVSQVLLDGGLGSLGGMFGTSQPKVEASV